LATKILYLSKEQTIILDGNYDTLKEFLEKQKNIKPMTMAELDEKIKPLIKSHPKLSNNKIQEINQELKSIEQEINEIDEKLEDDFTSYTELDSLQDRKDDLENRYCELLELLENDK
ncbi:MAG TPA: hypothetical protein DEA28_01095, partial [Firmicutes bacterium]|nr:hypothetical protein [Bacillota bacterium]